MNRIFLSLLLFVLLGCAGPHGPKRRGHLFSELEYGERLNVRYSSEGCFHRRAYDFEFKPLLRKMDAAVTVRVTALQLSWDEAAKANRYHSPKLVGTLTLYEKDLAGLDRLIAFYRTHPRGGSTTVDHITFKHFRSEPGSEAEPVAVEQYVDSSSGSHDVRGVLTLGELAGRLEAKP